MLHRLLHALIIAAVPLLLLPASDHPALSKLDDAFIHQIMNACRSEIRTADSALARHLTDLERDYAKQVIDLHLTMKRVLATIATAKNIATRDEVQADEQLGVVHAGEVTDKDFNAFYLKGEILSESAEIAMCEGELREGTDEDLKLFATTYLPSLRKNLIIAKEFAAKY